MKTYRKLIFVDKNGKIRAPMAKAIFSDIVTEREIEILARGLVVLFPEPMNPKAEAVLVSNGIYLKDYTSQIFNEEEVDSETLVVVMETEQKEKILQLYPQLEDVEVLTELTGDELEVMDPYGAPLPSYGLCFETFSVTIKKLSVLMNEGEKECQSYT